MNRIPPLQLLGTITKTHGIKGGVILRSESSLPDDIENKELVFISFDKLPVPFFIKEIEQINPQSAILYFEPIGSRVMPGELPGKEVYVAENRKRKSKTPLELSDLIGYHVIDKKRGELGIVSEIIGVSLNPLLKIMHHHHEILIPVQEPIITDINPKTKKISIQAPDGLIDLFIG